MTGNSHRCPSARCREGAELLGIVRADGSVAYLGRRVRIDGEFARTAAGTGSPETRFRFSDRCVEQGCGQWTGSRCGVIDDVVARLPGPAAATPLPRCAMRSDCRWFAQSGPRACGVCPFVITET